MQLFAKIIYFSISCLSLNSTLVYAWGPDGHKQVGAIADVLIAHTHAEDQVKLLLKNSSLKDAAVWADCAKGIDPAKNYSYQSVGKFPECKIYETPDNEAEMSDFVRRNDKNCDRSTNVESCHKQYHYADIAIQNKQYDASLQGARNDDIVAAISAAVQVLKGGSAPAPFNFKNPREALLVLAHYVGDIHQPLHIGTVYLDSNGKRVNPDKDGFDLATATIGGNHILINKASSIHSSNLHAAWDAYPHSLSNNAADTELLTAAQAVTSSTGDISNWPELWANDTLLAAQTAYKRLRFSAEQDNNWNVRLSENYAIKMDEIKKIQLAKAGKHLAELLQAIWP